MNKNKIQVAVIDGQGGGIGRAMIAQLKSDYPKIPVRALGTNAAATAAMLKAGADDGATGENAVVYNAPRMQFIFGPIGIITANGLLGEVTSKMAVAVGASDAVKILLPSQQCAIYVAAGSVQPMQVYLKDAVRIFEEELKKFSI